MNANGGLLVGGSTTCNLLRKVPGCQKNTQMAKARMARMDFSTRIIPERIFV